MHTLVKNKRLCPLTGQEVQVEEIYSLEGSGTCQIDTSLISWRCLDSADCPASASPCPLHREYASAGEKSMFDK